jgi:hypothetical protein
MSFPHRKLLACSLGLASTLLVVPHPARALDDWSTGLRDEAMRIIGRDPGDAAGTAVAVGDVSGDGIADILIGSPRSSGVQNSRLNSGEVAVVLGGVDLPATFQVRNAAHTFYAATESARLGTSVAVADLDGDGVGDIVMGAPEADAPGSGEGGVFVFYGGARLADDSSFDLATVRPDISIWGAETGARLGRALATGDFNGDGIPDLAVGAPGEGDSFGRHDCGVVYVFFGQQGLQRGLELFGGAVAMATVRGAFPNGYAGDSLAAGDIDGDGLDDLVIGAPLNPAFKQREAGSVHVVFGSRLVPSAVIDLSDPTQFDLRVLGQAPGDQLGTGVGAGDINGDGKADVLLGAPNAAFGPTLHPGRAYAIFGRTFQPGTTIDLRTTSADVALAGPDDGAELGATMLGGDLNGDGVDEWVVGAPGADRTGQAYRILGRTVWSDLGVMAAATQGNRPGDQAGSALAIGDVNGDGVGDLVMSSPSFDGITLGNVDGGAVYVFLGQAGPDVPNADCVDEDGDGFRLQGRTCGPVDCDDHNPTTYPGAPEICGDGLDNNCNGTVDGAGADKDGDGFPEGVDNECMVTDCNDHDPAIHPGAVEICDDGIDNNCDGLVDAQDPACQHTEVCNNCVDDDGNGLGDLLEPACQGTPFQINDVTAWRTRGNPSVAKQIVINGELPDAQLLQNPDLPTTGLIVGLAFPSGQQVCASLGRVTKAKNGGLVVRSTARPRSTLRLKPRKDGRVSFSFEQKTGFELPDADPMMLSVGFFVGDMPYRGSAAVQAKGNAVAAH